MAKYFLTDAFRKTVIVLICVAVFLHLLLFIHHIESSKPQEIKTNHDLLVGQVMSIVGELKSLPPNQQLSAVKAINIPNVTVSIDNTPHFVLRAAFSNHLWYLLQLIPEQASEIKLSLKLTANNWLNIHAVAQHAMGDPQIILFAFEMVIVCSVLFSLWTIEQFAEPLNQFRKKADLLGVEFNSPPLVVAGPEMVRQTAEAMNKMQQRINQLLDERMQMLAALSHDLRTPITRMKLRTHFITDKEQFDKTMNDLDEMEQMVNDSLAFAKSQNLAKKHSKVDLISLLETIVDGYKDMNKTVELIHPEKRVLIKGDSIALKRLFTNLIDNALKYGTEAKISLQLFKNNVEIDIDDNGSGIPEDLHEKIFEAYFRAEQSRSRQTGGVGLGLAVCKQIVNSHNGNVRVSNLSPKGSRFAVTFPSIRN